MCAQMENFLNGFFFLFFFLEISIFEDILVGSIFSISSRSYLIDRFDTVDVRKKRQNDFTDTIFFSSCHRVIFDSNHDSQYILSHNVND